MPKGHHSKFFPGKLRVMLDQVDGLGLAHGASWVSEGRAFAIHDPDVFMNDIIPQFFDRQTHLRSFHRQLSIWGFTRLETGTGGRGVWFHNNFDRDRPEQLKLIKRVPVKNPKPSATVLGKNQVPDYTNYQLPNAFNSADPKSSQHTHVAKPSPVRQQPRQNVAAVAAAPSGLPMGGNTHGAAVRPPDSLDYLAALRGIPTGANYGRQSLPASLTGVPPGYPHPSLIASNFQPAMATSMGLFPGYAQGGNNNPRSFNDMDLAQLLQRRQNSPPQGSGQGGQGGDGSNLNSAILSMIMDSRRRGEARAPPAAAPQAAAPAAPVAAPAPSQESPATAAMSNEELLAALAKRNLLPGGSPAGAKAS